MPVQRGGQTRGTDIPSSWPSKRRTEKQEKKLRTKAYDKSQLMVSFQEHRFKLLTFLSLITFEQRANTNSTCGRVVSWGENSHRTGLPSGYSSEQPRSRTSCHKGRNRPSCTMESQPPWRMISCSAENACAEKNANASSNIVQAKATLSSISYCSPDSAVR